MKKSLHPSAPFAILLSSFLLASVPARAEPDVLRPGSRPMFVSAAVGPAIGIVGCGSGSCNSASAFDQFKLSQAFGYHFSGDSSGPAIGVDIEEAVGDNIIRFQPGFKFWWDIQVADDLGIYVTPQVKAGYGFFTSDTGFGSFTQHYFATHVGVAGRLVLGDRGLVFLRPVTLEVLGNDNGALITYDIMAGGGVTF